MTVPEFIAKWSKVELKERSAAQEHFLDLCELLGHPKPAAVDPSGETFCFEKGAAKHGGGDGFADVWKKGFFGWEYKGRHKDLDDAFDQLLLYKDALANPPLLVVCDMDRIVVRTNFTGTVPATYEIPLEKLGEPRNLEILHAVFFDPEKLQPGRTSEAVTRDAAEQFAGIAESMRDRGLDAAHVAHFLDRIVFCLFAEDIGLLPDMIFSRIVEKAGDQVRFAKTIAQLFTAMAHGGDFGLETIRHFNGNLFNDETAVEPTADEVARIATAARMDWSAVDPTIFGTLFQRGMDPAMRAQRGAHFTGKADIEEVVENVIMRPLRAEWSETRQIVENLLATGKKGRAVASSSSIPSTGGVAAGRGESSSSPNPEPRTLNTFPARPLSPERRRKALGEADSILHQFLARLQAIKILDPACGSGNFLYVSLLKLKDLEKEVILFGMEKGIGGYLPAVGPWQLYGIEINPYAFDLAQMTVWIGWLQWIRFNGFGSPSEPILRTMTGNFRCMDAIIDTGAASNPPATAKEASVPQAIAKEARPPSEPTRREPVESASREPVESASGEPVEPDWPKVDFIVGNPPFLGGKMLRRELGDDYVNAMLALWRGRVPAEADLCCYWFEKARAHIAAGKCKRAGLLATQGIRGGANRDVLKHIQETGGIFWAVSDRDWILAGANVHVSIIGFDAGQEKTRLLDGQQVAVINANLSSGADITQARILPENRGIAFMGDTKVGPFEIPEAQAREWLALRNPNGKTNAEVVRPWANGLELTRAPQKLWIVDFPPGMSETQAAQYEAPFEYIKQHVKPIRAENNRAVYAARWWIHAEARPDLRASVTALSRYLATPCVSKHRIFVWLETAILPDHALIAFARADDYFFGILHSRLHEVWALKLGTQLETRPRYTPTTCFETFPFPKPTPAQQETIAAAARDLDAARRNWLGDRSDTSRTLTALYNDRPTWLADVHARLDDAVSAAYNWLADISDAAILENLLALNLQNEGRFQKPA